ncbi:hypothetical protein [Paraburkholderia sp. BL10I2N1]|uniref:hypothetical protein n=1 Tax=Paraburkholderia sp. BL10I2N1 TaxID=1938796 RepID=UPI00105FC2B2|nr:hypothetical protein [Paraburkholderia sp. BL10I2N1]
MNIRLISMSAVAAATLAFSSAAFSRTVVFVTHPMPVAIYMPPPPRPVYYYAPPQPTYVVPVTPVVTVPGPAPKPTSTPMAAPVPMPVLVPAGYTVVRAQPAYAVVPAANVTYAQPTMVAMPH